MSTLILNYAFNSEVVTNPDGSLQASATGLTITEGPGSTLLGNFPKAASFSGAGKASVDLPVGKLNKSKFCVRTLVKVDGAVSARQNLVESNALPISMSLEPIAGSDNFKAVVKVGPAKYGLSAASTEFAMPLQAGHWYLIDLIFDTDTLGVAVDGSVKSVMAFPNGTIVTGAPTLFIGTASDGVSHKFEGSMAALQFHDGIPSGLEALLDEKRNSPEWFITHKYNELKPTLNLGLPIGATAVDPSAGADVQMYTGGLIMYADAIGAAFEMHGAIFNAYKGLSDKSVLGFLASDEIDAALPGSRKNLFSKGGIYWSGATGAFPVTDQIYIDYELLGESAAIGFPTAAAAAIPGGREQIFQRARMYHKNGAPKAYEVHGDILKRFLATGGVETWGYPSSNEGDIKKGTKVLGRSSEFEGCTFYWASGVGAFEVHGAIRNKYRTTNGPLGVLGFPTSDEQNIPGAAAPARCNTFQNGSILWFGSSGTFVCPPFHIHLGRLNTEEFEGATKGQNDLYFFAKVESNGHTLLSKRYPDKDDYDGHNIVDVEKKLPLSLVPNDIHSSFTVTFDIWESDDIDDDDHLGKYSYVLNAANAWGMIKSNGSLNTGHFGKVNSFKWSVQPIVDPESLSEDEKWWGVQNKGTPKLTYSQYGAAFRDVDPDPEWWDALDWLDKLFYELVIKDFAKGGNCFGMSLEAIYSRRGRSNLSLPINRFTNWSEVVDEFNVKHQYQVGAEPIWWFVGQFLSGNTHDPVDVFKETRDAHGRGLHPVLCIAQNWDFSGAAHCVLPVAWDDSVKPWKLKILDPNYPFDSKHPTATVREIKVDPDKNIFEYKGAHTYVGGEWTGGRMHYMPFSVLDERPRTPVWDAIMLLLSGMVFVIGGDATTESITDENGIDLNAFGADSIARLKANKPLVNKLVPLRGFSGGAAMGSEVFMRYAPRSSFRSIRPDLQDLRDIGSMTMSELASRGTLADVLRPVVSDPKRFAALAGRELKAVTNDPHAMAGLDQTTAQALLNAVAAAGAGTGVRHHIKGGKGGAFTYLVKQPLSTLLLSTDIGANESAMVSARDFGGRAGMLQYESSSNRVAKLEYGSRLGLGKDQVKITVDKVGIDARKPLQVQITPGLGGIDIIGSAQGPLPEITIEATIGGKLQSHVFVAPFAGGVRVRPSTILSGGELRVGRIDTLSGPIRDSVMVKPK